MQLFCKYAWTLFFLILSSSFTTIDAQEKEQDNSNTAAAVEVEEDLLVQEILEEGRGERDERGIRDQWYSDEHLNARYDTRRPISKRVQLLLDQYRLDCEGCDHSQAVAKVNAFLKQAKEDAAKQAERERWLTGAAVLVTILAGAVGVAWMVWNPKSTSQGQSLGGGINDSRRLQIEEQRRRAADKEQSALDKPPPPTWRQNEEKEIWTPKQEKQFQSALKSFGGVPPKGRYILIAEKVDGKSRQECLMHHKLLLLKEQEQKEQGK